MIYIAKENDGFTYTPANVCHLNFKPRDFIDPFSFEVKIMPRVYRLIPRI